MNRCPTIRYAVVLFLFSWLFVEQAVADSTLRTLAEARGIEIRSAVNEAALQNDPVYEDVLATHFNQLTPELSLLFGNVHPTREHYEFTYADLAVNFAQTHGMQANGHTLVWYSTLPHWLINGAWTRDELMAILEDHIKTVVRRYKGRIASWDVINEAVVDSGALRNTFWLKGIGPDYIDLAFQWAHEADPEAMLFYKDFSIVGAKADAIYELVAGLLHRGVPIHGVNIQTHVLLDFTDAEYLLDEAAYNMKRLSDLDLKVNITEFEVPIRLPVTEDKLLAQAEIYGQALQLCLCSPSCEIFEMWGFTDRYSWISNISKNWGASLASDENYIPKPAYYSLVEVLEEFNDLDDDGIRDDNGSCTRITNPCNGGETEGCYDNCPDVANTGQEDLDADGIGDLCDSCPADPFNDIDGDELCADVDNCPEVGNPDQADGSCRDGIWLSDVPDGIGDACQDSDEDRLTDAHELATGKDPCIPAFQPVPDIKANGLNGWVFISEGENLTATISLDPGDYRGEMADWWIYISSRPKLTRPWIPIPIEGYQAPLVDFHSQQIIDTSSLPKGTYLLSFGIDFNPDGSMDKDQMISDHVFVIVR